MPHIKEELGDVLFQVVFYDQLGKEQGHFDMSHVIDGIVNKLISRHPHVFPNGDLQAFHHKSVDVQAVKNQWELLKQQERKSKHQARLLDDVPKALPALSRAEKLQKRAAAVNFDMPDVRVVIQQLKDEIAELEEALEQPVMSKQAVEHELGDILFSCVNLSRHLKMNAESTLSYANRRFEQRIAYIEECLISAKQQWHECDMEQLNRYWQQAKQAENSQH
jgi:ATP diphosphatase